MNGTKGTGPGPVPSGPPGPLSVKDAAAYFNISERAVRKRIHAGTLMGEQINGQWMVYPHAVRQGRGTGGAALGRGSAVLRPRAEEPGPEPPAIAVIERLVTPLVTQIAVQGAQIGDLREVLGRERTLREQAEQRTAELEQQLARQAMPSIIMAQEQPAAAPSNAGPPPPPRPRSILGRVAAWVAAQSG